MKYLWILFLSSTSLACQTIYLSPSIPFKLSQSDVRIEKVVTKPHYELALLSLPSSRQITLACHKVQTVQGKRRLLLLQVEKKVSYKLWREILEIPLLFPLSLAFLPFNLLAWAFGSEDGKIQVLNTFYYLNPLQNALIWKGEKTLKVVKGKYLEHQPGKKQPLEWVDRTPVPFRLLKARLHQTSLPVPSSSWKLKVKLALPQDTKEPVTLYLKGKTKSGQIVESQLTFIFDDTPSPPSISPEKAERKGKSFFQIASRYYQQKNFSKALFYYHQAIRYFRVAYSKKTLLPPFHPYPQSYLFRALSRLKIHTPNLKQVDKVPFLKAWRALIDLQTFIRLAPLHPSASHAKSYSSLLLRYIYKKKDQKHG